MAKKKSDNPNAPEESAVFEPSAEAIAEKVKAGLSKAQAIEVLKTQWEHDQTDPHD